jgi:hypothetical protein
MINLGKQNADRSYPVVLASDSPVTNTMPIVQDTFNSFDTTNTWSVINKATGDIIMVDGNALGSNYLSMALDPLTENTETIIESKASFNKTDKNLYSFLSASQRVFGNEVAIATISQTSTTLTVVTATPHNLDVGSRISISGIPDSRLNYCWITVATIVNDTTFTCTAGSNGNLPSVTSSVFNTGFVHYRAVLDSIPNGTAMFFENASATNASFFFKNGGSGFFPSGTIAGNHSVTIGSNASAQSVANSYNIINFQPTTGYYLNMLDDSVAYYDKATSSSSLQAFRFKSEAVVPNNSLDYKIRLKVKNNKSATIPVAQIVSIAKSGSTTATVTTDVDHGLTTNDVVNIYGVRDATNFPNLTSATAVASIVNSTTFTIVIGPSATATSFGGYVSRVNGAITQSGAIAQVIQSISRTSNILTVIGSANWAGLVVGDYINIVGCRDISTGATIGIDGSYKVIFFSTTSLVLQPISGYAPTGSDIVSTNCGGGVIKKSVFRIHKILMRENDKYISEVSGASSTKNDQSTATPVQIIGSATLALSSTQALGTVAGVTTVTTVGSITSANMGIPLLVADQASGALTTTTTSSTITPASGCSYEVNYIVTAVTGTNPTLDVVIQESDDGGTNWFDVYHFQRITASGAYRSPKISLTGNRVRYVQTVGGTSPSFTRSINRLQSNDSNFNSVRQIFDRAISLTTLNATTASLINTNAFNVQLAINIGTATTAPILQLEGSFDNTNWFAIGSPLTAVASSTVVSTIANIHANFIRARVSTAGATVVAGYVAIKTF